MTTREKFKRVVIEAIHGLPYDEAIKKEEVSISTKEIKSWAMSKKEKLTMKWDNDKAQSLIYDDLLEISSLREKLPKIILPITIGRVMQAIPKSSHGEYYSISQEGCIQLLRIDTLIRTICNWKLTKEDGQECTDDDQADETILKLLNLLI